MISLKSQITKKLLNYFFLNPQESLYVNELSRNLALDKRNLVKKIKELEKESVLKSQKRGNLKLYHINKGYPLYNEYKQIILKTIGFEENLKNTIKDVNGIKNAYIYGSYAKNTMDAHSDIDLLIIGSHSIASLQKNLNKLQKEINREINVVNIDEKEYNRKIKNKDPFITGILKNQHIRINL
ncbi:MAG: nucleotidyltransferase domain-containing protein [Candidatus Omnitrophica bacterium]|nr:nucleotidyltransferase domain-containing protein [Candidatus Omnitrophota bacterium]MBU1047621.1 nucleotidyltransferase domain-containing protein [Candidatus Omnitrophota bacterium]MBU1767282.1 nucleotidyltransferase domain-containing protein [Candidatus Omnitrophota bacterium]MBU1888983.1 nucleotidyltransferase domain-containing protein [Candidatus Omnitrophota bacterium]